MVDASSSTLESNLTVMDDLHIVELLLHVLEHFMEVCAEEEDIVGREGGRHLGGGRGWRVLP